MQTKQTEYSKMVKRRRKPLTEEQKNERRERLAKARASKAPPKYVSVDPAVRELPDDHPISLKKVREWIKSNKEEKARLKKILRTSNDRHVNNRFNIVDCYLQNMEYYIRNGVWLDLFYGENQENKMGWRCETLAYESDGMPKRNVGVFYPDIGGRYTAEDYAIDNPQIPVAAKRRKKKRKSK